MIGIIMGDFHDLWMSKYQNPSVNVPSGAIKLVLVGVLLLIVIGVVAASLKKW